MAKVETYRTASVQEFIDKGTKPKTIKVKKGLDPHSDNTIIAYEFTIHGIYFRVPRVPVAFAEDIDGPLFDESMNEQIDDAVWKFKLRQDKQRNNALTEPIT